MWSNVPENSSPRQYDHLPSRQIPPTNHSLEYIIFRVAAKGRFRFQCLRSVKYYIYFFMIFNINVYAYIYKGIVLREIFG